MTTPSDKMREAASQVPLVDLLRGVPRAARLLIDSEDGMSTRHIPVGRLCHEAAVALSTLPAPAPAAQAVEALRVARDIIAEDRDAFVYRRQVRDPLDPVADGLVLLESGVWIDGRAGKILMEYDSALDRIDAALSAPAAQPAAQQAPAVPQGWSIRSNQTREGIFAGRRWITIRNIKMECEQDLSLSAYPILYEFFSAMLAAAPQAPAAPSEGE